MSNRGARWQRGTLRRRGDSWIVRIREDVTNDDGTVRRKERAHRVACCKDVRTRTAARMLADVMVDKMTGRGLTSGSSMLAAEYLRRYIAERVDILMKPASRSAVRGVINKHLLPAVRRLRLEQVTTKTAQLLVSDMVKAKNSPTTIRNAVRWLGTIMKTAKADGIACVPIDVRAVKMPSRIAVDHERRGFTLDEVKRLIAGSQKPWSVAYAIQATLGLRCNEVMGLTWRAINLEAGTIQIRQGAVLGRVQSLKSKTSAKTLAMSTSLIEILRAWQALCPPNIKDLVFATRTGMPVHGSWYRERLKMDLVRLGIPHRGTHAFRHFTATQLLASGLSLASVRDQLRHSNASITNTYSHAIEGDLKRGAELLGVLLAQTPHVTAQVAAACGGGVQTSAQTIGQ